MKKQDLNRDFKGDPIEIINGKKYYVVDDRVRIPPEIMAMSKEELEAKIKEFEAKMKKEREKEQGIA